MKLSAINRPSTYVVIERDQNGVIRQFSLANGSNQIKVKPTANYTVIDLETQKPPQNLVLKRIKETLRVEEDGQWLVDLEDFYTEEAVTFTTDGSFAAVNEGLSNVVTAGTTPIGTLATGETIIWSTADVNAFNWTAPWVFAGAAAVLSGSSRGEETPAAGAVDTVAPTATLVLSSSVLGAGQTATLTITFSEPVIHFDISDLTVENGSLSGLTTTDGGKTWTAIFTPSGNVQASANVVRLAATYTDLAGNAGVAATSENYTVDTVVTIDGLLQDDYIAFAEVFADVNNNGVWDDGEPKTTTDENGHFVLTGLANTSVTLIAVGGIDTASGVPNNMVYRTSASASQSQVGSDVVISPMSTLITSIAEGLMRQASGETVTEALLNQAAAILSEGLGLNLDNPSMLLNFDAVYASSTENVGRTDQDVELLSINRQVSVVVAAVGALVNGADPGASNTGTLLSSAAFAELLIEGSQSGATFSLKDAEKIAQIVQKTMTLANESGLTEDLRATSKADVDTLSLVIATFNNQIDVGTKSDAGPMSADAIAAMVAVNDLMIPLLQNTGGEAVSGRGGDISLAGSLQQFVVAVDVSGGTTDFVGQKIETQKNATTADFGSQQDVAGYVGDYVPLAIQLPSLGIGDVVDSLVLDLRELAAQTHDVQLFRFDPLSKTYIEIDYSANPAEVLVDPKYAGYLFVKASAPLIAQDGLFAESVELPITAKNTTGEDETTYAGLLTIIVRDRPLEIIATIAEIQDDVAGPAGALPQSIGKNGMTNDATPLIRGTLNVPLPEIGEGGEFYALELYDGNALLGTATVNGTNWTFQTAGLADGQHPFTARVTFKEPDGDVITLNWASLPYAITVDTVPPTAPVLDVSAGNVVTGSAEAGSTVTIVRKAEGGSEDVVLGTALAGSDGRWTYSPTVRIADSADIAAYAVDRAGNTGPESGPIQVDWLAPTQRVTISAVTDDVAPATGNVPNGGSTNDDMLVISGTISAALGERESLVIYREGSDQPLTGTLSFEGGNWRFASDELPDGEYRLFARVELDTGVLTKSGADSSIYAFAVDTVIPQQTVSVLMANDDVGIVRGEIANTLNEEPGSAYAHTNDATPTFNGTLTEELASNELLVVYSTRIVNDVAATVRIGSAVVAGSTWTFTPGSALADGDHTFTFQVEDKAGNVSETANKATYAFTIDTRTADNVMITSGASISIEENIAGVIYTASADRAVTWRLSDDSDPAFVIDPETGAVSLISPTDFESRTSYSFTVIAYDGSNSPTAKMVTLSVTDLDEVAPTITSGGTASVGDNSGANQLVYKATASDDQDVSAGVSFSLKEGLEDDAALFSIDAVTGEVTLKENPSLESRQSYVFTVLADDGVTSPTAKTVTLNVVSLDEVATASIDENIGADQVVYKATASDHQDVSAGVNFRLKPGLEDDAALFSIDPVTGEVTLKENPNHEGKQSYVFTVLADDGVNTPIATKVTLNVINLDEVAPAITSGSTASIDENSGTNQVVYKATASDDQDVSAGVSFSLKEGLEDNAALFSIDAVTGEVTLKENPDHESEQSYAFTVVATDAAGNASERAVVLSVTDVAETEDILSVAADTLRAVATPAPGETVELGFTLFRSNSAGEATVDWTLSGLSAADLLQLTQLGLATRGKAIFKEGVDWVSVTVNVPASMTQEAVREAVLTLLNPSDGYAIDADNSFAMIEVVDANAALSAGPRFTVSATNGEVIDEGAAGQVTAITYTITRSGTDADVGFEITPSGAALVSGHDFCDAEGIALTSLPSASVLDFNGQGVASVTLYIRGDNDVGPDEQFNFVLTGVPQGSRVVGATGSTIRNDDAYVSVSAREIEDAVSGDVTHEFVVTRSGTTAGEHRVSYVIAAVGENATDRFNTKNPIELVFADGDEAPKIVSFTTSGAEVVNGYQSFGISLTAGENVTLLNAQAISTVNPNVQDVSIAANIDRGLEGGAAVFSYTVMRSGDLTQALELTWAIVPDAERGVSAEDFSAGKLPSGTIRFEKGISEADITFSSAQDFSLEGDEGFRLVLDDSALPDYIRLINPSAEGVIVDDEAAVGFAQNATFSVLEGDSGISNLMVTVTRIGFTGNPSSVEWRVTPGTADLGDLVSGQDLLGDNDGYPSGVLTLLPGEALGSVAIRVVGDAAFENGAHETLVVTLTNPSAGTKLIGTDVDFTGYGKSATATITNDDSLISIVETSISHKEKQGGDVDFVAITIKREGSTLGTDWVKWTLTSSGEQGADNADLGAENSAFAVFNSYKQSWIDIASLSGKQTASGTIELPKSGYIMVAYNRDLAYEDYDSTNMPFDQFLLKNLSVSGGATITSLGSVMSPHFLGDDLQIAPDGVVLSSEQGLVLPDGGRQVTITTDGDLKGLYFRVSGENADGSSIEEFVKAPSGSSVATAQYFAKVTGISAVPANIAVGSLYPAQDYYEEHNPDEYFDDLAITLASGQLFNTGENVYFDVSSRKQGAHSETGGDTTYITLSSDADLSGISFLVTGGVIVAKFDNTTGGLRQEFIESSPTDRRSEIPGGAKIRAEQLSGLYQGTDESDAPSHFMITGRTTAGVRMSEIVAVEDFDADRLAGITAYETGNLIAEAVTLDIAGRVVFSGSGSPTFGGEVPLLFTVKGTDAYGKAIQETVFSPYQSGFSFSSSKYFKTVTEISANQSFAWPLEIGHTKPVETVHDYVQVYGVAPVDAQGNALPNNQMQSTGRIEFTVPKQFVIEGDHAGIRLSADMVNYIDTIEVVRENVAGVKIDIGFNNLSNSSKDFFNTLPNGYSLRYDDLYPDEWSDAGGDMYDGGNQLYINDVQQAIWNTDNSQVFSATDWGNYVFGTYKSGTVLAVKDLNAESFRIDGNIGADGRGERRSGELAGFDGVRVFYDQVYAAGDPSINKIVITNARNAQILSTTETDDDYFEVTGLGGGSQLIYILFAGESGYEYSEAVFREVASRYLTVDAVVNAMSSPTENFLINASSATVIAGAANGNIEYYDDTNNYTDNPVSYPDNFLSYVIFRIDAPTASATTPAILHFDLEQVGRYGIDTGRIAYAPGGIWSTGVDAMKENGGVNLLIPTLKSPIDLSLLSLDFFSNGGEIDTLGIHSVRIDDYSGNLYYNVGSAASPDWIAFSDYSGNEYLLRDAIIAGKLAYDNGFISIEAYLYGSAAAQEDDDEFAFVENRIASTHTVLSLADFASSEFNYNDISAIRFDTDEVRIEYNMGTEQAPEWITIKERWEIFREMGMGAGRKISGEDIAAGKVRLAGTYAELEEIRVWYNNDDDDAWLDYALGSQPVPEMVNASGSVALPDSGYIWIRYANKADSGNDGADQALIKSMYVDGGATLSVVGQKVIKDGVAMSQALGDAGDLDLDGVAVSHEFRLPENFNGNLLVHVSSNDASAHLQNGVYRIVGTDAAGSTVTYDGSWGSTDYWGGWAGGFEEGQSVFLKGLDGLVSIQSIRFGEYTEELKDNAQWGDHSPYELYDPKLSFSTGDIDSLASNQSIPLNIANWNRWYFSANSLDMTPGAPLDADNWAEQLARPDYERLSIGAESAEIVSNYSGINTPERIVISTLNDLAGRTFVISGTSVNDAQVTERLTFGEGDKLVYTVARFKTVDSIVAEAGQAVGHVDIGNSYDYVTRDGYPLGLMARTYNLDEPSFILSGIDQEGQFKQIEVNDLRHTDFEILGVFSEILALQATSAFSYLDIAYIPAPDGLSVSAAIKLNNATPGVDGLVDLGGEQRVVISGGSASRGQTYRVVGRDAEGNVIEELIEGIGAVGSRGDDDADDGPSSEYGGTLYGVTTQYFSKVESITVTNWHPGYANVLPVVSVGTISAPIAPDQSVSRYGQEVELGYPVARFETASRISFTSEENLSDRIFTITGTLENGSTTTEQVNGPNAGIALSVKAFLTVSNIAVDDGAAGSVKVGYVTTKGGLTDNFHITGSGTAVDPYVGHSTNTLENDYRYDNEALDGTYSEADILLYVNFNGASAGTVNLFYDLAVQGAPGADALYVEYASNIVSLLQGKAEFLDGESEITILIPVAGDDTREADELMTLTLTTASTGATIVDSERTSDITIVNDDDLVTLDSTPKAAAEGNEPGAPTTLSFSISRLDTGTEKEVRWHLEGLSSEEGAADNAADELDFAAISGVVTFAADALTATIDVVLSADRIYEGTETFRLVLSEPVVGSGYSLGNTTSASGTITEDDVGVAIAATDTVKSETDGAVTHTFTVTRVGDVTQASSLVWTVSGTSATEDIDATPADFGGFYPANQALEFNIGETSKTITVTTTGDKEMTGDRAFTVSLANASGDTSDLLSNTAQGLIIEDDAVNLSIGSAEVRQKEDSLPVAEKVLTYTLSRQDGSQAASYRWKLLLEGDGVNLVASAEDFSAAQDSLDANAGLPSGTVSFSALETSKTITVRVASDALIESDEAFKLRFEGVGVSVAASQDITAYLVNDTVAYDMEVRVGGTIVDSFKEGDGGTTAVVVTFLRAGDSSEAATLTYSIEGVSTNPITAEDFVDLDFETDLTVTFEPLQSAVTRTFLIVADSMKEETEAFRIVLKNGITTVATRTISVINDDAGLVLEVSQSSLAEGTHSADASEAARYSTLTYTVYRSGDPTRASTVKWQVKAEGGIDADDFHGYNGQLPAGSISFAANDPATFKTFTINVLKDWKYEGSYEDLVVELVDASVGTQITTNTVTTRISDDDKEVGFAADSALPNYSLLQTALESSPTGVEMVNGTEYVDLTYTVIRIGNDRDGTQTITWTLSGANEEGFDAALVDAYSTYHGAWQNNDVIGWVNEDRATSGTLVFENNDDNTKTITIRVHKDHYQENPEAFKITLSNPTEGLSVSETTGVAVGHITDDDIALVLSAGSAIRVTKPEGQPAAGVDTFTDYTWIINREGIAESVELNWSVQGHSVYLNSWVDESGIYRWGWTPSATANSSDFDPNTLTGTLSFAADETSKTLTIRVLGDETVESTEAFKVVFTKPSNVGDISGLGIWSAGNPTTSEIEGIVLRDEGQFAIVSQELDIASAEEFNPDSYGTLDASTAKPEGDTGYVSHFFKIYRDFTTSGDASVDWRVENAYVSLVADASPFLNHAISTAATAVDFVDDQNALDQPSGLPSGRVTIPDGDAYVLIEVKTRGDLTAEDADSFQIRLSNPSPGSTVSPYSQTAMGYIANDDHPLFSIGQIIPEGDNDLASIDYGSKVMVEGDTVTYTVYRSGSTAHEAKVDWSVIFPDPVAGASTTDTNSASNYTASAADFDTETLGGTLTFAPEEASRTITLKIKTDGVAESWAEAFSIALSNARWGDEVPSVVKASQTPAISAVAGTMESIIVDANAPTATVAVTAVQSKDGGYEGTGEVSTITYTLTKTGTVAGQIAWKLQLPNAGDIDSITGDTNAVITQDTYEGRFFASGLVAFGAQETVKTITVKLNADTVIESNENFVFTLIDARTVLEQGFAYGNEAEGLGTPWGLVGSDGTANANSAGIRLLDAAGNIPDSAGMYRDAANYTVTSTVKNDDGKIVVNNVINHYWNVGANVLEGDSGPTVFTASITRYGRVDHDITVDYVVLDSVGDEIADSGGTWTLSKNDDPKNGNGQKTYTLDFELGDGGNKVIEPNETYTIRLKNVSDPNVTFNQAEWTSGGNVSRDIPVTIVNDDTVWSMSATTTSQSESDDFQTYTFSISRPNDAAYYRGAATVTYRIVEDGGTYTIDDADIVGGLGERTVSFVDGETSRVVTFRVAGDTVAERDETFKVELVRASQGVVHETDKVATFTILNDDTTIEIANALSVPEGDVDGAYLEFDVIRKGQIDKASSSVKWTVQDGTATVTDDLTSGSDKTGSMAFDDAQNDVTTAVDAGYGEQTQKVRVYIKGDTTPEADQSLSVSLSEATDSDGIMAGKGIASGTILNDDSTFSVSVGAAVFEADAKGQVFTITRTHATAQDQTVNWSLAGTGERPAQEADFVGALSGSVTFTGSELSKDVIVSFVDDAVAEYDETFTLTIALGDGTAGDAATNLAVTGTIKNDDATLTVGFGTGKDLIREGSGSDIYNVEFVVYRNYNVAGGASATWTLSGAAVDSGLFATTEGTVTFEDGDTQKTVRVAVTPNETYVGDKTFAVTLSNSVGAAVLAGAGDSAAAKIVDDDSTISVHADAAVLELNSGSNAVMFSLDRTGSAAYDSLIGWRVVKTTNSEDNAKEADFLGSVLPSGTLTLAAGETSVELAVPGILGDLAFEGDETFTLELIAPVSPDAGLKIDALKGSATGTILNNEARVDIESSVSYDAAVATAEGSEVTFTVVRTGYLGISSTVSWDVAYKTEDPNGTGDFVGGVLPSGFISFAPGESRQTITVQIAQDNVSELDEVFRVKLGTASEGTSIGAFNSFFKVVNDDADRISLAATTPMLAEGDGAEYTTYTYTLTRENPWIGTSVDWVVEGGVDHPLADRFQDLGGTANFVLGQLTTTFDVLVRRDDIGDFDRTFAVTIRNPSTDDVQGATLMNTSATVVVQNDDPAYAVALSADRFVEGSGTGNKLVSFTITRSGDVSGTATIRWSIGADEDSAYPANLSDFGGYWPTGVTAFADGESSKTIQVAIAPDSSFEADEGFKVVLSELVTADPGARIIVPEDRAVIGNDDIGVTVETSVDAVLEGNDGHETPVMFTLRAEGVPHKTVTVNFVLEGSGNSPADADDFFFSYIQGNYQSYDFDPITNRGHVVLRTDGEGQAYADVFVQVRGDGIAGVDETFRLRITGVQGGTIAQGMAEVIIENDDVVIASIVNSTSDAKEGNAGEKIFTFVLTRMGDVSDEASISYVVEGFGDNPADHDDFVGGFPEGLATFAAGSSTATIEVRVSGDVIFESDEGFIVIVGKNTANEVRLATEIRNDELAGLEFNGLVTTVFEGNGGSAVNALSYEIIRSGDNSTPLTVGYVIDGGSAGDFAESLGLMAIGGNLVGSIVIPAGESRVVLNLPIAGDMISGMDREFTISIEAPGFASPSPVSGNVVDDDAGVSLELVGSDTRPESDETIFTFRVNRVGNDLAATTLAWVISGIGLNPASADDFSAATGMLAFTGVDAGASSKEFTVTVINDAMVEKTEAFRVTLTYPESETNKSSPIRVATADAHISDDDFTTNGADLIYGGAGADVIDALAGHDMIRAGAGADVIYGGDGDDTIYGEGGADAIYGGAGDDRIVLNADNISHFDAAPGQASTYIDGGLGYDRLVMEGADIVFDFSAAAVSGAIRGVELIDIKGSGDNTLLLSLAAFDNVFDAGSPELRQLTVDGDAGDTVVLLDSVEWVRDETEHLGYFVWNHQSVHAQLLIHSEVSTTFGNI